jgi:hypothetical protein
MYRPALGLGTGPSAFDAPQQRTATKTYGVSANVQIFLCLVKGKPNEIELNRLEVTKAKEITLAVEAP